MEAITNLVEIAGRDGLPLLISILTIVFVGYYIRMISPELKEMNLLLSKSINREDGYVELLKQAKDSDAKLIETIGIVNANMLGSMELMKSYYEDNKALAGKLTDHDVKSEQLVAEVRHANSRLGDNDNRTDQLLYEMKVVNERLLNLKDLTCGKFDVLFKERGIVEEEVKSD